MTLSSHPEYKASDKCGCGADNARFDFVPDTIYGLSIKEACCVHDDRYGRGGTAEDKTIADREFLTNLLAIIDNHKKWYYPTFLARRRALNYYEGVTRAGYSSFNFHYLEDINV